MVGIKINRIENPDTRARIVQAAIACVNRWGLDKVTVNDIARDAGVTRPTVYSYFESRDEIVRYVLLYAGQQFVAELLGHIEKFSSPEERIVEKVLFCLKQFPKHPGMTLLHKSDAMQIFNAGALTAPGGAELRQQVGEAIFSGMQLSPDDFEERTEIVARFMLSLLLVDSPKKRNEEELRDFLRRRLLPAVGFGIPAKVKRRNAVEA